MQEIKDKIAEATEITKDLDGEIKLVAFRVVLEKLLSNRLITHTQLESKAASSQGIMELANQCAVSVEDLHLVLDIDEAKKEVNILHVLSGNESEKQKSAAIIYMTSKYYLFQEQTVPSRSLTSMMKNLGIGALDHLAKNLKTESRHFVLEKSGSKVSGYKITVPGLTEGKRLIKKLITEGSDAAK